MLGQTAVIAVLFALFSSIAAVASPLGGDEFSIPYERYVLPNGLRLIIHEDHKAPVVAVNVWYGVGSKDERSGRTGMARLVQYLMSSGSEHHPQNFWQSMMAAGGTQGNMFSWYDGTSFSVTVPTSALDRILWMEADRMGHFIGAVDQKKLDEQRKKLLYDRDQERIAPYGQASELIARMSYPLGHPYSHTPYGATDDLSAISLADVKEWHRTYYGAANAVIVVAGDVKASEVKNKVERYFSSIPSGRSISHINAWVAKMHGVRRAVLQDRVPRPRLYKVWNIPGYRTRDHALLQLAADILGNSRTSRLGKRFVSDEMTTGLGIGIGPFEIGSQFTIVVDVKSDSNMAEVEQILDEEMFRFLETGPTDKELERVKATRIVTFATAAERVGGGEGKAAILGLGELYGGTPDFYKQYLRWIEDATAADVQNTARRWLSDGTFVLNVHPISHDQEIKQRVDDHKMPAIGLPPTPTVPPVERAVLSNGLPVLVVRRGGSPLIHLNLTIAANDVIASANPGTANLTFMMLERSLTTNREGQVAGGVEEHGTVWSVDSNLDASEISVTALKRYLPEALELIGNLLLKPSFSGKEFERLQAHVLGDIERQKDQVDRIFLRLFPRLVYGDAYAYSNLFKGLGDSESVAAITNSDVQEFYLHFVRPENAILVVVGNVNISELMPLLETALSGWGQSKYALRKSADLQRPPARPKVFLVDRPGPQDAIIAAIGKGGPVRGDSGAAVFEALSTILSSRIDNTLCQLKGIASAAGASILDVSIAGVNGERPFTIFAYAQSKNAAHSIREMLRELSELRSISNEDLNLAKDKLVRPLAGRIQSAAEVAKYYTKSFSYGLPHDYLGKFMTEVNALTVAELQAALENFTSADALTWFVIGDLSVIETEVRRLNVGEITYLDADGNVIQ